MDKRILALALAASLSSAAFAQIVADLGPGGYGQNFDSLPKADGVDVGNPGNLGSAIDPLLDGFFTLQSGGTAPDPQLRASGGFTEPGDNLPGALFSFAPFFDPAPAPDRALGSFASAGSGDVHTGLRLRNNTGTDLLSVNLAFILEQYREAGNSDLSVLYSLNFSYRLIDPALSDAAFAPLLGVEAGWNVGGFSTRIRDGFGNDLSTGEGAAGSFVFAPKTTNGSPVPLNGNSEANRRFVESRITFDSPLAAGADIAIRFSDRNDAGTDPGIGIDNLSLRPGEPVPEPASLAAIATGIAALLTRRRKKA